jgi:hypothetical protein
MSEENPMPNKQPVIQLTAGNWDSACDSYGKVTHSRHACVYSSANTPGGERLITLAGRIQNWDDARVMAAAKDLYIALKYMNHCSDGGYCICPINNGMRPDKDHATTCADARKAIRKVESPWANPNSSEAEAEWMQEYHSDHKEGLPDEK